MIDNVWNMKPEDEDIYYNPFQMRDEWMTARQYQQVLRQWEAFTLNMQTDEYRQRLARDIEAGEV